MSIKKQTLKEMANIQRQALGIQVKLEHIHSALSNNYGAVPTGLNGALKSISRFIFEIGEAGHTVDKKFI